MVADSSKSPVLVVGIGADGWTGMSPAARRAVTDADVVIGSARQLELLDPVDAELIRWPSPMLPALPDLFDRLGSRRVCALASGDPMLFGLGSTLSRVLGPDRIEVVPHQSSVSLACARLRWAIQEVTVISAVGRSWDRLRGVVAPGRRILVLSPDEHGPARVAKVLAELGYRASELTVLEQLGGPGERVTQGRAEGWDGPEGDPLVVVAVHCVADPGTRGLSTVPGLPDDVFENDGQLTKREVRALTLARLEPLPGQLLWDVGAGAGSIAIEWLRADQTCRAIAVEHDETRAARIGRNAAALGVPALDVVVGRAPEALDGLETPSTIFIGGGVTAEGVLPACWSALRPGGRLVANAVTVEAEAVLAAAYADHGGSLTRIEIQRAAPIGGFTGWRPAMPVTQWVVDRP
ncbi:bifunctional cobalt-precorrin-7 (C(5))-methyltransferase/cobalt-precorrin-6B (C(15))-methyltransferase [Pseudonocardia spinosispora]|uniref:bifunctional cobalt-precorrin-7 (C(5))-methyltransferase/cobalt-precorrin-6B (C(15))-methyltransferase n=1 Tax=Pseudonocardia spinosispora TaxID=103441 RepID=UPI00040F1381|nr:bifunctional cobalt-precorrin-7 (C(5))-methyltransferase/cobalt-precorrin-6B (C(15))-methyltransferase [Pseudonocardia spinosispora]